jgi:F-type H+-transporting ATPase subunit delta
VAAPERKYAAALYEAALEHDRLAEVGSELNDFLAAVHELPKLRAVLGDPAIDLQKKTELLGDLLAGSEPLLRNFLRLLAEKNRLGGLEEIGREFGLLVDAGEQRLRVVLTTARKLDDGEVDRLVARIEKTAGREVEARLEIDPALIGGLIVQAGSLRLDASVRGRLEKLRQELVETRS